MDEIKPTNWDRVLTYPIELRDGHRIETLQQGATLITRHLPKSVQERPGWGYAAELLMQAYKTGKSADIRAATDQLHRALEVEGWLA